MKSRYRLLAMSLLLGLGVFAFGEKAPVTQPAVHFSDLPKLASLEEGERLKVADHYVREYYDLQSNLITQLDPAKPKEVIFAVAYILGLYRMDQSAHALSRFIALENEKLELHSRLPRWDRYPVVEALIRIGRAAIPEMIRNIETSDDEKVRGLSARVIRYVEGIETGKFILDKAAEQQTDAGKKARLKTAVEGIK